MPRTLVPLATDDVSALAKSLRRQLAARAAPPGHLELLNMLARATGHPNYQALRAGARPAVAVPVPAADEALVERAAGHFDAAGRLASWPARTRRQALCLWGVWSRVPAARSWDEPGFSALLDGLHGFGDRALLRRSLCSAGLVGRTREGRDYRRVERAPPADAAALIRRLRRPAA